MQLHKRFPKPLRYLSRRAQVILPKDFGSIVAHTGLSKDWVVVEGGSGSGFLTIQLARVVREVHSYEIREDHYKHALKNIKDAKLDNVILNNSDISEYDGPEVGLIILDLKDAHTKIEWAYSHLKSGGYLVAYLPNTDQLKSFVLAARDKFKDVFALESLEREWEVREFGARPVHTGLTHTAFLVFCEK